MFWLYLSSVRYCTVCSWYLVHLQIGLVTAPRRVVIRLLIIDYFLVLKMEVENLIIIIYSSCINKVKSRKEHTAELTTKLMCTIMLIIKNIARNFVSVFSLLIQGMCPCWDKCKFEKQNKRCKQMWCKQKSLHIQCKMLF